MIQAQSNCSRPHLFVSLCKTLENVRVVRSNADCDEVKTVPEVAQSRTLISTDQLSVSEESLLLLSSWDETNDEPGRLLYVELIKSYDAIVGHSRF